MGTLKEAQILIAHWRRLYNTVEPDRSWGRRPPAPETIAWQGFALTNVASLPVVRRPASGLAESGAMNGSVQRQR